MFVFKNSLLCASAMLLLLACNKNKHNPNISIGYPAQNSRIVEDSLLGIQLNISDTKSQIAKIEFWIDDSLLGTDSIPPFEFVWHTSPTNIGKHSITAIALAANRTTISKAKNEFELYDLRTQYLGNFRFTVHQTTYGAVYPAIDTIIYYDGKVKNYAVEDDAKYMFNSKSPAGYSNTKITLEFLENKNIIANLQADGTIDEQNLLPHQYQKGKFSTFNNLQCSLENGGLGGGYKYEITATRI